MGTTAQKLEYLGTTKSQLKDMINYGLDDNNKITSSTTFREYVSSIFNAFLEALRTPDTLFTNLPKKSGTGANITLNDTANAPMRIQLGATELTQAGTPTPDSPQDIHTISGSNKVKVEGKNIVDIPNGSYTMTNYWYRDFATNKLITSDMVGKKISFSYDIDIESISTTSTEIIGVIGRGNTPNGMSSQIATATYSPTTGKQHIKIENKTIQEAWVGQYLVVRFAGFSVRSDCTYNYSNVQIEYGETASNFEPYISQEADIDLGVPNLFTGTNRLHERYGLTTTTTGNRITINGSASNNSYGSTYFNLNGTENANANYYDYDTRTSGTTLPAGTYRVSATNFSGSYETTGNINLRITYFTSSNPKPTLATITLNTDTTGTFTLTEETTVKIQIQIYVPSGTTVKMNQFAFDIELIKGSTQQRGSFNPIEYCKIGNYEDKFIRSNDGTWQLEKNIGKVVLDENIVLNYNGTAGQFYNTNQNNIPNYKTGTSMLCNYLNYSSTTWVKNCFGITGANVFWLYIENGPTALADLQTWLSTHNLDIRYILNTPTYTQITGALATQLENIYQKLLSYSGTTNISQINNDLSFNMSVQAIEEL